MSINLSTNQLAFEVVETEKQQTQDDQTQNQTQTEETAERKETESGGQTESDPLSEPESSPETLTYKGPRKPAPYISIFQPLRPAEEASEAKDEAADDNEDSCESEDEYLPTTEAPPLARKSPPLSFEKDAAKPSAAVAAPGSNDDCVHCDCGHSHDDFATIAFTTAKQTASDVLQAVGARVRSHGVTKDHLLTALHILLLVLAGAMVIPRIGVSNGTETLHSFKADIAEHQEYAAPTVPDQGTAAEASNTVEKNQVIDIDEAIGARMSVDELFMHEHDLSDDEFKTLLADDELLSGM